MSLDHQTLSGLYVHLPFCKTKCPYCDFYSVTDETLICAYLAALDAEARLYRDQFPILDSLFLGGGTPSWLGEDQIAELVKNLRRHFTFAPDSEITLEANPDDLTADKLALFRELGINRLSLGVQSFDEAELRFLGRRHTARQTAAAIDLIRAAGLYGRADGGGHRSDPGGRVHQPGAGFDVRAAGAKPGRLGQDPGAGPEL
jgi:oxygen-independent coproporphyrinogen III oxidase